MHKPSNLVLPHVTHQCIVTRVRQLLAHNLRVLLVIDNVRHKRLLKPHLLHDNILHGKRRALIGWRGLFCGKEVTHMLSILYR